MRLETMFPSRHATRCALLALALGSAGAASSLPASAADGVGSASRIASDYERATRRRPPEANDEARIEAARRKARAARKAFEDARDNSTPDDWVYVNPEKNPLGMRRFPKPEYEARLAELERKAKQAEDELERLERAR